MPSCRPVWLACFASAFLACVASPDVAAQSFNGAITGVVRDSTGGVVADTALTLRNIATDQTVATTVSGRQGTTPSATWRPASTRSPRSRTASSRSR